MAVLRQGFRGTCVLKANARGVNHVFRIHVDNGPTETLESETPTLAILRKTASIHALIKDAASEANDFEDDLSHRDSEPHGVKLDVSFWDAL